MTTKKTANNYLQFSIATTIVIAIGYALSLAATSLYYSKLTGIRLPIGDTLLVLGGMYFAIVAVAGVLIAYFYERFRLS